MARATRLKVYLTRIGLSDWVVSAPCQKAALKAWDVRVNLFSEGAAIETQDPSAIALALKAGGQPVVARTYTLSSAELAKPQHLPVAKTAVPPSKKSSASSPRKRLAPHPPPPRAIPPPPPPDHTKLDAAEEALRAFRRQASRQRAVLERRRAKSARALEIEMQKLDGQEQAVIARLEREPRRFDDKS